MNKSVFLPRNLFYIFLGCNIFYSGQNVSGIGVPIRNDSRSEVIVSQLTSSASYRRSIDSPFVTVGAVITAHDFNTEMSKALRFYAPGSDRRHHGGSEKKLFEEFGLQRSLSDSDINLIVSSWDFLKKRLSSFAPKLFIGYLKARPDSKKMFPDFAHVNIAELATNVEFCSRAYNCVASLNYIIPHLKRSFPVLQCPALKNLKTKYNQIDPKSLGIIWVNAMQEELDKKIFTDDVRVVWQKVFSVLKEHVSEF